MRSHPGKFDWGVSMVGVGQGNGILDRSLNKAKRPECFTARAEQWTMGSKHFTPDPKSCW